MNFHHIKFQVTYYAYQIPDWYQDEFRSKKKNFRNQNLCQMTPVIGGI